MIWAYLTTLLACFALGGFVLPPLAETGAALAGRAVLFFRRALRLRREPAAPEVPLTASGAVRAGGSFWEDRALAHGRHAVCVRADRQVTRAYAGLAPWEDPDAAVTRPVLVRERLAAIPAAADTGEMRAAVAGVMGELASAREVRDGLYARTYGQAPVAQVLEAERLAERVIA